MSKSYDLRRLPLSPGSEVGDQPAGERIKEMGLWFKWVPNMEPRSSAP